MGMGGVGSKRVRWGNWQQQEQEEGKGVMGRQSHQVPSMKWGRQEWWAAGAGKGITKMFKFWKNEHAAVWHGGSSL